MAILLLDTYAARQTGHIGVVNSCILVDFTEQILAIDQLQGPAPERLEFDPAPEEFLILMLRHPSSYVRLGVGTAIGETFLNARPRPGTGSNEFHLRKVQQSRVVEIGHILVGAEVANRRIRTDQFKRLLHRPAVGYGSGVR